ncbi:MAG: thioredoxin domain-containing protein, partial [Thermoproteota archaeon]|nr:thioredoxin domain-containing protein [Thermoproteota archaeon]
KLPVVVDFWAPWCSPCKQLTPILEKTAISLQDKIILAKINIDENQSTSSLIFTLFDPGDNGVLSFTLSDDVITPFDDGSFIVMIDGVESDYTIEGDAINIPFNSDNEKIEIIGTYVVPEFYEIAPLVLATSFIGLMVLRKYKKLFV